MDQDSSKQKHYSNQDLLHLATQIKHWGSELGFQQIGIADIHLSEAETHFLNWLKMDFHGEMYYMAKHGIKRSRPQELESGTISIISASLNYYSDQWQPAEEILDDANSAYISRYALGRDYHKVLRKRLQKLAYKIEQHIGVYGYRVFTDSAPVLEKALAEKARLGWIGKHSNLIQQHKGSWFFLGEIYTDLPLPVDSPAINHCGDCQACIDACPTKAIVAPYQVDARRCISYLTIELKGSIPHSYRALMGNRIYGCDDCQLVCPWNRFAVDCNEFDFQTRHHLDSASLLELFQWSEAEFLKKTEGSAIRRIGYVRWLRNIAVALGNADRNQDIINALKSRLEFPSTMLQEHIIWALQQQQGKLFKNN